ncbi:MAG: acyltransferase, partial [Actinomyces sp.]|nr:acyltransferase [Actinomyces sp.]
MVQVLLFHAWHVGSPIGVDAFIMISAFLMTSSFVRRSEAGSMPHFLERWANTFKRLLPPLVLVVLATVGASLAILPQNRWPELLTQAFASLTYWQNWRLVQVAADYYADDHGLASPLQHLWSMSMQGQVFLLWPLIMTVCVLLARATGQRIRTVTFGAFALLSVASLAWLLMAAPTDGSVYFDTRARIWEF